MKPVVYSARAEQQLLAILNAGTNLNPANAGRTLLGGKIRVVMEGVFGWENCR